MDPLIVNQKNELNEAAKSGHHAAAGAHETHEEGAEKPAEEAHH
jgi:hypothetical protein